MANNAPLNIFVTGGTTSVGREACRQAKARGHNVTVLTEGSEGAVKARQDGALPTYSDVTRAGELRSLFQMAQTDVVLHLAAQLCNGFPVKGGYETHERMMAESAQAVVSAAITAGVKFIVYASFASVYGDAHGEWLTEDDHGHEERALRPALAAEQHIMASGVPACVLRAGFNYGEDDVAVRDVADHIMQGRPLYLGDSHTVLNWIHAADLASAAVLAAEQQPAGQTFNVVNDNPTSASAFASQLATGLGVPSPVGDQITGFRAQRATSEMQRLLLATSARLKNDKAKSVLGWTPRYPDIQSGIDQMLLGWRASAPVKV
ncbi:MAG: NAD(P)-dependent oxidoreductase [Anaerolineae bacterium]